MTQQPSNPAEVYEQYFVPAMFTPWAQVLLERAAPLRGERVLDLACGTGAVARLIAPMVGSSGSVIGLELSPAMLAVARKVRPQAGAQIEWREGDATALPFTDQSFDLVVCQQGLQFFPDRAAAAREVRRVLAPGGRAVLSIWQSLDHHDLYKALFSAVAGHLGTTAPAVAAPFSFGDGRELRGLFKTAMFGNVEVVSHTQEVRFPSPDRFVQLTISAAAAVLPVFSKMGGDERASLITAVKQEIGPTLARHTQGKFIAFPMTANFVIARA